MKRYRVIDTGMVGYVTEILWEKQMVQISTLCGWHCHVKMSNIEEASKMEFEKGERVTYMPAHVEGHYDHPDIESGVVSSVNESGVFVKFDNLVCKMVTGDEPYTAKHCRREDLVKS